MNKSKSISARQKKRGRPATGHDPMFGLRMPQELVEQIDAWGQAQMPPLSRSEAIRALVVAALKDRAHSVSIRTDIKRAMKRHKAS
jgi:Arc/MetJ-type ribon-helix-helix transcriptional regulator